MFLLKLTRTFSNTSMKCYKIPHLLFIKLLPLISGNSIFMSKYLIVGLGNAGNEYANTRHNIGFDVIHAFVTKHNGVFRTDRLAYVADLKWKGKSFTCICPTTYMNLSGRAFKYWLDKEKV